MWATAHYDAATGKFVSDSLADEGMQFFTTFEDGTDIVGGFRITGIDTLKDIAVVESNADIAGYAYKLTDANEYNANSKWSGADSDNRTVALKNVYYTSYAEVNMTANKTLIGRKLEAGEFDFALYTVQGDSYSKQIKTGIKNDATGKVDFGRITYSLDDLGTETAVDKYYKIVENKGTNQGVSYDDKTAVYVKVHLHKEVDATSGEERIVADEPIYSSTDMKDGSAGDGVKPDFTNFKGLSKDPILETNFENELLMSQLISEIRKNPDHISLTMTGTGLVELIKAVQQVIYEEINEEKANQQDSDIELITKQDVIDKLHVSSTTLWIWEKRKYLVPVKIGRRIFYKRRDVNNLMGGK